MLRRLNSSMRNFCNALNPPQHPAQSTAYIPIHNVIEIFRIPHRTFVHVDIDWFWESSLQISDRQQSVARPLLSTIFAHPVLRVVADCNLKTQVGGLMAKQSKNVDGQYVRKETFWLVILLALAVGFFGGVMFGVFKTDTMEMSGRPAASPPAAADADMASMIAALEKETRSNPANLQAWIELGNSYFDTDQYQKSIDAYRKALEIAPGNANVWTDLGVMYRRNGNPQEAINAFNKAIAADPKHEVSRMNKGIVLLHDLKDTDAAIEAWEGLLEINPVAMAPTGRSVDEMVQQIKKQMNQ